MDIRRILSALLHPSFFTLLFANGLTIYQATVQNWPAINVMWIYLIQSIIIGGSTFLRLLIVQRLKLAAAETQEEQMRAAVEIFPSSFFVLHYGMFHFVYLIFLIVFSFLLPGIDFIYILNGSLLYLFHHIVSFVSNRRQLNTETNTNRLVFLAYSRIIPMHLTIILGMFFSNLGILWLFMGLKTIADIVVHVALHYKMDKK